MAESPVRTPPRSGVPSTVSLTAVRPSPRPTELSTEVSDIHMHDGPDFVDDWMEKNLTPSLIDFVRNHCTSFAKWDLMRHLHSDPLGVTLESLARITGAAEASIAAELKHLEAAGIVARQDGRGSATYHLQPSSVLVQALEAAVRTYEQDREFRFAMVYSIVRASHKGAVVE